MTPRRIEELLRSRPPDEPDYHGVLALDVGSAKVRSHRILGAGVLGAAVGITAAVAVVIGLLAGQLASNRSASPSSVPVASETPQASLPAGVIPWTDATPVPSPTPEPTPNPMALPACTAAELALTASGWSGATGSLAGGALLVNVSGSPCRVSGKPAVELLDATGALLAAGGTPEAGTAAQAIALQPGGVAIAPTVWMNWCGAAPRLPLGLRLRLPAVGGQLTAVVHAVGPIGPAVPRCDAPTAASTIGVPTLLTAPEPSAGGYEPQACSPEQLMAFVGGWNPAAGSSYTTLVILNAGSAAAGFDCRLPTSPVLEVRDAKGHLMAATRPEPASPSSVVLPLAWAAAARVAWANWCSAAPTLPLQLNLVIGSTRLDVSTRSAIPVPPCMSAPQTPPTLAYGSPLTVPGSPAAPEPDPCDALPVSVSVSPLPTTRPGSTLTYTVTLTNHLPYDKPLNLAAFCPNYTERLFAPGSTSALETHLALNWQPGTFIPPGGSATFAMRLGIPADAAAGTASLVWQLGERGPATKVTFQIAP